MKVFTVKEVAKLLKIQENTVRKYINSGELPASKIGNIYRITEEDLKQFLEDTKTGGEKEGQDS